MSYILDALRRADAERQRGQVPGLNAPASAAPAAEQTRSLKPLWLVGGAVLLLFGGALWWWLAPGALRDPPRATVQAPALPAPVAPAPAALPAPPPAPAPLPIVVSGTPSAPALPPVATPAMVPPPAPPMPRASAPAAAPASPAVAIETLREDQRRELPRLAVGGSVWSDSAASRFVILDGQVLREGDTVSPGLVLEKIERRSVILRWRDQRLALSL